TEASLSSAAWRSETISHSPCADPGAAFVGPGPAPHWTEHAEPGGVNWTTPEPGGVASCLHPRLEYNFVARSESESGIETTSSFMSTARAVGSCVSRSSRICVLIVLSKVHG